MVWPARRSKTLTPPEAGEPTEGGQTEVIPKEGGPISGTRF